MQVHSTEAESRRNQRRARDVGARNDAVRDLLRIECLAVEDQLGIELSRAPAVEYRPDLRLGNGAARLRNPTSDRTAANIASTVPAMKDAYLFISILRFNEDRCAFVVAPPQMQKIERDARQPQRHAVRRALTITS